MNVVRFFLSLNLRFLTLAGVFISLNLFPVSRTFADAPEYLEAEKPIPRSLKQTVSPTDRFGLHPEYNSLKDMLIPTRAFSELRSYFPPTGESFIDDTIFFVHPRAYYRRYDRGDGSISEAASLGGAFGFETGYWHNFMRVGVTGYTSQELYGPSERPGSDLLSRSQDSYTVLGEAFLEVKVVEETHLKLFRQRLHLPYINANDSRMTPNTFEAYTIHSTAIEKLRFGFSYIDRIKFRNSSDFESMSAFAGAPGTNRGVSVFGARYDFSDNFHTSLIEEYGWDTINTLYLETERFIAIDNDLSFKLRAQFTDQRSVGDEYLGSFDTQHAGIGGSLGYRSLIASVSLTWTSDNAAIIKPWGGSPSYNSVMISDFDRAGERSVRASLSHDFTDWGLKGVAASTSWVFGDTPDSGPAASSDQQEFNVTLDYRPPLKYLDNFWFRIRYAWNDLASLSGGEERSDFRVILNYSLAF